MLASIVSREGRVLSFEPSPVVFPKLLKTIAANGLGQVVPMNVGCGAARSVTRLHQVSRSSGNATIVGGGSDSIDIHLEALDEVAEAWVTPVALLKIDTEG
jgi:FkbM family methyltransferase